MAATNGFVCSITEGVQHNYQDDMQNCRGCKKKNVNIHTDNQTCQRGRDNLFHLNGNLDSSRKRLHASSTQINYRWMLDYACTSHNSRSQCSSGGLSQKPFDARKQPEIPTNSSEYDSPECPSDMASETHRSAQSEFAGVRNVPVIVTANGQRSMAGLGTPSHNYVYNPVPIRKKSKKNSVPVSAKDNHYWMLRIKNNIAARKSREDRRKKEIEIVKKCDALISENQMLRQENIYLKSAVSTFGKLVHVNPKQ